jgi:carboxymethylenebutenolidase
MPLESKVVSVPRANQQGEMESFFAHPQGAGPFPGLIVIHEIFGLNDNIREITGRFAGEGYAALAVDLFANRSKAYCMLQAFYGLLFKPLNNPLLADLQSTLAFLKQLPGVDPQRLGVVGFCMGGGYALQLAVTEKGLKAASVFYGANPRPLEVVAQACPVVGSYPDKDFTTQAARELDAALTSHEIAHDIKIYDNTQHSFFGRQRTPYEVEASKDSWQRMLAFFEQHVVNAP